MASESMWTGAMRSSKNLTISRNGFVGCLGNVNFRVISLCSQYKRQSQHQHSQIYVCSHVFISGFELKHHGQPFFMDLNPEDMTILCFYTE